MTSQYRAFSAEEIIKNTFSFWKATRLEGASASMADGNGPVDANLCKAMDAVQEKCNAEKEGGA